MRGSLSRRRLLRRRCVQADLAEMCVAKKNRGSMTLEAQNNAIRTAGDVNAWQRFRRASENAGLSRSWNASRAAPDPQEASRKKIAPLSISLVAFELANIRRSRREASTYGVESLTLIGGILQVS